MCLNKNCYSVLVTRFFKKLLFSIFFPLKQQQQQQQQQKQTNNELDDKGMYLEKPIFNIIKQR